MFFDARCSNLGRNTQGYCTAVIHTDTITAIEATSFVGMDDNFLVSTTIAYQKLAFLYTEYFCNKSLTLSFTLILVHSNDLLNLDYIS